MTTQVKSVITLIFIGLFLGFNSFAYSQGANHRSDSIDKQIIHTLKKFYIDYINQCDQLKQDSLNFTREKYCTKNLLDRLYSVDDSDYLDYDPFLQAQDCDRNTIPTLKFWKDSVNPNLFFISYIWPYREEKTIIRAIIKREDTFKIDSLPNICYPYF